MRSLKLTKAAVLPAAMLVLVTACGSKAAKTSPTTTPPKTVSPSSSASSNSTTTPLSTRSTTTTTSLPPTFRYLYVWPFRSVAEAQGWQRSYESGGHQSWHLDAGITATGFTHFLGVDSDIGEVIKVTENATDAHVAVGFHNPNGVPVTATTVHLVRISSGSDAPWEVVDDDQTSDITLTTPSYGATVSSPMRVGGRITGVDESIRVGVYQWSSSPGTPIGNRCCLAAGGQSTPWTTTVSYSGATDIVLVITASTGGHLQGIEQMAFTAVRRTGRLAARVAAGQRAATASIRSIAARARAATSGSTRTS